MFDLSDLVPLTVQVSDPAGNPANATAVTLTVTLPDGTTTTPAVSNPSAGLYQADYPPPMPGRYMARWAATGINASGFTDTFDVRDAAPAYILSLGDAKRYLAIDATDTTDDEELRGFIESITPVIEDVVGPVVARQFTEVHQPGRLLALRKRPVISLISVVQLSINGTAIDVTQLDPDYPTGIVRPLSGYWLPGWAYGTGWPCVPLRVTYTAGRQVIPANHTLAARVILDHMWQTQRGHTQGIRRSAGSRLGLTDPDALQAGMEYTATGYMIPRRALELLQPDRRAPLMA